jgi:diguanylate cyclase (GGDEF)-like protein
MPRLDGFAMARELREDPSTRLVPVIVLTARHDAEGRVEAFRSGADDLVEKPFDCEELEARMAAALRRSTAYQAIASHNAELTRDKGRLENLLMHDEKTGLYNFREFQRRLHEEWSRAVRYATPLSLVMLDLDHFKEINDALGHQAGDRVLREFATLVTGGARANDVAARWGGEEFAIILPHTEADMAERVAERIRSAVGDFVFLADERPTRLTVSAGVAMWPSPAVVTIDDLVRRTDRALYAAKEGGRNRVVRASG